METLREPYALRANLSFDLVGQEAVNLFSEKPLAEEVRFERVKGTELMYNSYWVPHMRERPPTRGFNLHRLVDGLLELKDKLTLLTSLRKEPSIRVIRPDTGKNLYAVFINE